MFSRLALAWLRLRPWVLDHTYGPLCEECRGFRCRGWRTLIKHYEWDHADAPLPRSLGGA